MASTYDFALIGEPAAASALDAATRQSGIFATVTEHASTFKAPGRGLPGVVYVGKLADIRSEAETSPRGVDVGKVVAPEIATFGGPDRAMLALLRGPAFSKVSSSTALTLGVPNAGLVLFGEDRIWFGDQIGFGVESADRDRGLWDLLAAEGRLFIDDLQADARFLAPVDVAGVPARFFAGAVFRSSDGTPVGAYFAIDTVPHTLADVQVGTVAGLGGWVQTELARINDLDKVAEVQRALLPKTVPPLPGYQVAGVCLPAQAAGGDFYDWYAIDGGLAFTLADVMGKGVAAAILAATVRATVRSASRKNNVLIAVERSADALAHDLDETESFVTLFHARLEAQTGRFSFADAGHGLTLLVAADGSHRRLEGGDLPLGIALSDQHRNRYWATLEEGGTLVTFSDGVLDLYDGSLASVDAVAEIVRAASSAQDIVDEVARLAQQADQATDDITVLAIRRSGSVD